ncbi:MAG: hypothetical protein AMXMBFR84_33730 [Candidatus Hydrogenedentota bacterium]
MNPLEFSVREPRLCVRVPGFGVVVILLVACLSYADDRRIDSVKIYTERDCMYQVTGSDLARAIDLVNTRPQTDIQLGPEILTVPGAARGSEFDSNAAGGFVGIEDVKTSIVSAADHPELGMTSANSLKVENSVAFAEVRTNLPNLHFAAGKRYRVSCKIYCPVPDRSFDIGYLSNLSGYMGTQKENAGYYTDPDTVKFSSNPDGWIDVAGTAVVPDTGEHTIQLWIKCREKKPAVWYLDDVSIRALETIEHNEPYRDKTAFEREFTIDAVSTAGLNLYFQGETVPIVIEAASPNGLLTPDTRIFFWGTAPRLGKDGSGRFTKENTYVLQLDSHDAPHRYQRTPPLPRPKNDAAVVTTLRKTAHLEKNAILDRERFVGAPTDYVMWARCWSYDGSAVRLDPIPDSAQGSKVDSMRVSLWGRSYLPVNPDHQWRVLLNDKDIGTAEWDGRTHYLFESSTIGDSFIAGGENTIRLKTAREAPGVDGIALDWIEVDYTAELAPTDDFLEYTLDAVPANHNVRLAAGFVEAPVRVFSRTRGLELNVQTLDGNDDRYFTEYTYPLEGGTEEFRAVGPNGFVRPDRMLAGHESLLRSVTEVPQFLVISHRYFMESLDPLLAHRQRQGMTTLCVDVEDIYDEYSDGQFSPAAIRRFLDDLQDRSAAAGHGLEYVFLVGDASYDYLNVNHGSPNLVPTYHTEEGSADDFAPIVASDEYFVYGSSGVKVPKVAIGRFPCDRVETLANYIEKVLAYESENHTDDAWTKRAVLIDGWNFSSYTSSLAKDVLREWENEIISSTGDAEKDKGHQARIVDAVNRGCGVASFVGHGSYYVWRTAAAPGGSTADLFTTDDLDQLTNEGKYPIVFSATCFSALYDEPSPVGETGQAGKSGIGVYLLEARRKGAVALIAHVSRANVADAQAFNSRVMDELANYRVERLGDAFLEAKRQFAMPNMHGMVLLGDPALLVGQFYGAHARRVAHVKDANRQ